MNVREQVIARKGYRRCAGSNTVCELSIPTGRGICATCGREYATNFDPYATNKHTVRAHSERKAK